MIKQRRRGTFFFGKFQTGRKPSRSLGCPLGEDVPMAHVETFVDMGFDRESVVVALAAANNDQAAALEYLLTNPPAPAAPTPPPQPHVPETPTAGLGVRQCATVVSVLPLMRGVYSRVDSGLWRRRRRRQRERQDHQEGNEGSLSRCSRWPAVSVPAPQFLCVAATLNPRPAPPHLAYILSSL